MELSGSKWGERAARDAVLAGDAAAWRALYLAHFDRLAVSGPVRFRCPEHPLFEAVVPALELPALVADTFLPTAEAVLDVLDLSLIHI